MSNKNTFYDQNKKKLKESQNRYYPKNGKAKSRKYYKSIKRDYQQSRNSYTILSYEGK